MKGTVDIVGLLFMRWVAGLLLGLAIAGFIEATKEKGAWAIQIFGALISITVGLNIFAWR